MSGLYSKQIMEHFQRPRNVGKMVDYDGLGKAGNLICGDILWLYIKVGRDKRGKEIIKKASFATFGCTIAIANSSLLTTMIKGKTLKEAMKITKEKLLKRLKKVPAIKIHCSVLAADALSEAIYDYLTRAKKPVPQDLKKRHRRIVKEKKLIEEKYQDWLKFEQKTLKARKTQNL